MDQRAVTLLSPAARLLYPYGSIRRIHRGPLKGMRYVVAPSMGVTYAWGVDAWSWGFLSEQIKPGMTVYDAGANCGQMSLFFARAVGREGSVHSYEPEPSAFAILEKNIDLNRLDNVTPQPFALSDRDGKADFVFSSKSATQGKLADVERTYEIPNGTTHSVSTTRLDTMLERGDPPPNIIKVDVEGGAGALLRGASRVLERHRPCVFVELHGPDEQRSIRDELQSRGYVVQKLDGTVVADPTAGWSSPLWCSHPAGVGRSYPAY